MKEKGRCTDRPVVVGGDLDDWGGQECPAASDRPPECQTVGFMGGGAWNPGQVPSPVVDNIHEGLPPSLPLSHPPKNLLPQQCCCRPLASQSRSPFQTEPAPAAMAEEERGGKFGKLCGSVSPFSQDIGDNPRNKIANKEARLLD